MSSFKFILCLLVNFAGLVINAQPNICFRSIKDIQQPVNFTPGLSISGDFNLDGYDDLGVLTGTNQLIIYNGTSGIGMSSTYTINVSSNSNILLYNNFNSDNFKDLIVAKNDTFYVLLHNGINGFLNPIAFHVNNTISTMISGDFNNDSNLDLIVGYNSGGNIYLGSAGATFSVSTLNPQIPLSPSSPDMNNDGYDDIVGIIYNQFPPNNFSTINVYTCTPNIGLNASISMTVPGCYGTVETSDLNGDGLVDLVYYDPTNQSLYTFTNTGQGSFSVCYNAQNMNTFNSYSSGIKIVDYTNDNIPDLIIKGCLFFEGIGSGKFKQPQGITSLFYTYDFKILNTPNPTYKKIAAFTPQLQIHEIVSGNIKPYVPLLTFMSPTVSSISNFENITSDVDIDGNVDIVSSRDSNIILFNGYGNGNFKTAKAFNVGKTVNKLIVEDINNDNFPDYITYNSGNTINTFLGSSNFSLTPVGSFNASVLNNKIICKDFDNDGLKDILTSPTLNSINLFKGNGNGNFNGAITTTSTFSISSVFSSDFNNDGYPDLLVTNDTNLYVRQNNGTGFNPPVYVGGYSFLYTPQVYLADLTNDSNIDIMTYNGSTMKSFIGNGNLTFTSVITPTTQLAYGICNPLTDFNGDNYPDVLISSYFKSYIQTGTGKGNFNNSIPLTIETYSATNVTPGDFNNDGIYDMVFNNGNSGLNIFDKSVFLNYTAIIKSPGGIVNCGNSTPVLLKTAKNAFSYSWQPSNIGMDSVTFTSSGIKSLTITSQNGNCVSTNSILINSSPLPGVSLTASSNSACINSAAISLTGIPLGGIYSGSNISGNNFNPSNSGTFTATYFYTDSIGCSNSAQAQIIVDLCIGIPESSIDHTEIYPNPTTELLYFKNFHEEFTAILFSSIGQVLKRFTVSEKNNYIQLTEFSKGIYFLKIPGKILKVLKE